MEDAGATKRPSPMEVDQSPNKRPRTVNDGLRHKTWYVVVMKEGSPNNGLETGLHWSAQPGCGKGAFLFHETTSEAQEYYDNIEVEQHWHGDETNACPLVMLEMKLLCSCQKRLVGSGVMKPEKNTSGKVRMQWRDVLRESIKDDGWGAVMGKEIFHVRVLKEVNGCDGGMRDGGMPARMQVESDEVRSDNGKLYGIIAAKHRGLLDTAAGLHWSMQPGGWGSFTLYKRLSDCPWKYKNYQSQAIGQDCQPELCLLTVTVQSADAWDFLEREEVLVGKKDKHYWKMPIHGESHFVNALGVQVPCYVASVEEPFSATEVSARCAE